MKQFKLTKIKVEEGRLSMVSGGKSQSGVLNLIRYNDDNYEYEMLKDKTVDDIKNGDMIFIEGLVDFLKTSPVAEVVEKAEGYLKFRTMTSVYELKEVENE